MSRSFRRGIWTGIVGSAAFLAAVVGWIYRRTGKVPFPVSRPAEGELIIRLIPPDEVSTYWQRWKEELRPVLDEFRLLGQELKVWYKGASGA